MTRVTERQVSRETDERYDSRDVRSGSVSGTLTFSYNTDLAASTSLLPADLRSTRRPMRRTSPVVQV